MMLVSHTSSIISEAPRGPGCMGRKRASIHDCSSDYNIVLWETTEQHVSRFVEIPASLGFAFLSRRCFGFCLTLEPALFCFSLELLDSCFIVTLGHFLNFLF